MYGKVFSSIYEGTLHGQWEAIVVMQQLIVLCDQNGVIDMTPPAIAARTSIPINIIEKGLKVLAETDPYSRTPGHDGKRIVLLDEHRPWGWMLVNHAQYRAKTAEHDLRSNAAERKRRQRKREKEQGVTSAVTDCHASSRMSRHTDTDTNTDLPLPPKGSQQAFAAFWQAYPKKRNKGDAEKAWKALKPNTELVSAIHSGLAASKASRDWTKEGGKYVPYPASWLRAKGWEDELETTTNRPTRVEPAL